MDEEFVTVLDIKGSLEADFFKAYLIDNGFEVRESKGTPRVSGLSNTLLKVPVNESKKALQFIEDLRKAEIVYDENFPEP